MTITIPLKTVSEANTRGHWSGRSRRAKLQRVTTKNVLPLALPPLPVVVTITRLGKRMLDSDNLAGSQKHVRDGIADAYGIDDGSDLYDWQYRQEIGKQYAVRIEIVSRASA